MTPPVQRGEIDPDQAEGVRDSVAILTAVFDEDLETAMTVVASTADAYFTLSALVGALAGLMEPLSAADRAELQEAWVVKAREISAAVIVAEQPRGAR